MQKSVAVSGNSGGLLGSAPVMRVPTEFASTKFIERRGRFPSPILALRN